MIDKSLEENKQSMINNYLKDTEVITALQSAAKGMKLVKPIAIKQPMISNWFNDTNAMKAFQSMEIGMRPIKAMQIAFPEKNFAMSNWLKILIVYSHIRLQNIKICWEKCQNKYLRLAM